MRRTALLLAILVAPLAACFNNGTDRGPRNTAELQAALAGISAADVHRRIGVLAHDSMRGRDTPSPELEQVARWIADEFRRFGLRPGAGNGEWIQHYPYPLEGLDPYGARFDIASGGTHSLEYGASFYVRPGSGPAAGADDPVTVPVTWMGDWIRDGADLEGRAALLRLAGTPEDARGGYRFPSETRARVSEAVDAAGQAGAAAVVFVLESALTPRQVAALAETEAAPRRALGGRAAADPTPPVFFITREAAHRLFRAGGMDAGEELRRVRVERPAPLDGVSLRLAAPMARLDDQRAPNVVGLLPGSDPELRDTYVVLTAHMDHIGVGAPDASGDSIYNGADDDASGTSALLEVAEAFAALGERPRRSLLFVAVSGEEKGLLGSRWFSDHPTVPEDDMVANLNMDMVGRNAPDSIVVIGQE
ncbi:MAG TPA: M20/M25/M40 family metallo-hydrolase, partial [Longimicrobiales bacterium]|nr:M20/M25/M40 family metallo-hydrolase [Longimicrobiales bacterium]